MFKDFAISINKSWDFDSLIPFPAKITGLLDFNNISIDLITLDSNNSVSKKSKSLSNLIKFAFSISIACISKGISIHTGPGLPDLAIFSALLK